MSSNTHAHTHTHAHASTRAFHLPSIGLLFGCVEGDVALLLVTRKLAGSVSDTPRDAPLMSLGLNFFLHDGALRKFLSSSLTEGKERGRKKDVNFSTHCICVASVLLVCLSPHLFNSPLSSNGHQTVKFALQSSSSLQKRGFHI